MEYFEPRSNRGGSDVNQIYPPPPYLAHFFERSDSGRMGKLSRADVLERSSTKPSVNTSLDINWRDDNRLVTRPYK